jgi:hypothetical protein
VLQLDVQRIANSRTLGFQLSDFRLINCWKNVSLFQMVGKTLLDAADTRFFISKLLCKVCVFTAVTMKNAVCWVIKTEFVPHRKHITSPLKNPAG